jgi:tetratricopeptide (TPR) repeat protein
MHTLSANTDKLWQKIFYALAALSLLAMPLLSVPHGMSGDEWSLIIYGHDIYDYFFKGSKVALDYDVQNWAQVAGLHYYGGLYDFVVTFLHKTFFAASDELAFRHVINSLLGAGLFIYTGLVGKQLGGWRTGVFAMIFIALSPRILGESMNNPKDIPFAFASMMFLYYLLRYIQLYGNKKAQWKYTFLMGLGFGLSMGFRIGGILMIPYSVLFLGAYYLWNQEFSSKLKTNFAGNLKTIGISLAVMTVVGYIIGIMFWPWALQDPLSRPLEALDAMTKREVPLRILFDGAYIMNTEVPNTYTATWIFISTPIFILISFLASFVFIPKMSVRYGKPALFLSYFILIFPIAYAVYKHSVLHDTWRHFFFAYPGMVLVAALLCNYLMEQYGSKKAVQYGIAAVMLLGMALPAAWIMRSFPNEYVYFNEFEGGIKNAVGRYDLDYYQNSGKQATEWIKANAKPKKDGKIIVASNMSQIERYFAHDTDKFLGMYMRLNDRDTKDWDYYITYSRYISIEALTNGSWPPANAAYIVKADDVPLSAVLERKTKLDMVGNSLMEKNLLDSAFKVYSEAVKIDASNDAVLVRFATLQAQRGDINSSLASLDAALKIDAGNPAIYNLQMQIYRAIGDNGKAQAAENKLRELMQ